MDIVWHKGQLPRKMEMADNGDFDKSANMDYTWARCDLSHFQVDASVAGEIPEEFPRSAVGGYVEITLYYVGYDDALFCCSYTQDGLQCVHISTLFLIDYGGIAIAPRSDEGMESFVEMLMQDLDENGLFAEIRKKQR